MVKILAYFIPLSLFIFLNHEGQSQNIQGAIAGGINFTQVDGDEIVGFKKVGLNAAAIAIVPFKEKWAVSLEASFNQKGAYQKYPPTSSPDKLLPYYNLRLNYAEVPVIAHFTDKEFLTVGLGLSWGRLVGVKEIEWGQQTDVTLYSGDYSRNDISGLVDIRFPISGKLNFNFRYSYSFASIRTRTYSNIAGDVWTRDQYNNVLTFRVYYIFNERYDKRSN